MMPHKFNNGEWCELYVPAKIMLTGELPLCDADLKLTGKSIDVLSLVKDKKRLVRDETTKKVMIEDISSLSKTELLDFSKLTKLLTNFEKELINNKTSRSSTNSFALVAGENLINEMQFYKPKAGGKFKHDVTFETIDPASQNKTDVGFSIKSQFASPPTLLNFGRNTTRFKFYIRNFIGDKNDVNSITKGAKLKNRIEAIKDHGGHLEFEGCSNKVFENNLIKIDTLMPQILSELLIQFFSSRGSSSINDVLSLAMPSIEKLFRSKIGRPIDKSSVEFKLKHFLLDVALGMVPSEPWEGIHQADGGYIIVRENLNLVCLHIYNLSHLRDYLFNNVRFESPSSNKKKGDYCYIYTEDSELKIDLQLQIRFT